MPTPTATTYAPKTLSEFAEATVKYAAKVVAAADKNKNGKLTRAESKKLGDMQDKLTQWELI